MGCCSSQPPAEIVNDLNTKEGSKNKKRAKIEDEEAAADARLKLKRNLSMKYDLKQLRENINKLEQKNSETTDGASAIKDKNGRILSMRYDLKYHADISQSSSDDDSEIPMQGIVPSSSSYRTTSFLSTLSVPVWLPEIFCFMPTAGGPSNIDDELLRENLPADIDSLTASPGKKVVRFALDLDDWKCKFGGTWERTDQTGLKELYEFQNVHALAAEKDAKSSNTVTFSFPRNNPDMACTFESIGVPAYTPTELIPGSPPKQITLDSGKKYFETFNWNDRDRTMVYDSFDHMDGTSTIEFRTKTIRRLLTDDIMEAKIMVSRASTGASIIAKSMYLRSGGPEMY